MPTLENKHGQSKIADRTQEVRQVTLRPRRSALYMPGSNARALEKAKTLEADVVIFDLEDAVAPDAKEEARSQVMAGGR